MNQRSSAQAVMVFAIAASAVCGCQNQPVPNQGRTTTADPAKRVSYERELASKDLVTATDAMVQSIASRPEFREAPYRITIVMDDVVNNTSMPGRDFEIYLARIRAHLNESGARYNLAFVLEKAKMEQIRRKEGLEPPPAGSAGADGRDADRFKSKADYVLRGEFYDMPNAGTNFYLLTFQIVDLHDGEIVWEGSYEVKFN